MAAGPEPLPTHPPQQSCDSERDEVEQAVRRWARQQDVTLPDAQLQRLTKFLHDWTR